MKGLRGHVRLGQCLYGLTLAPEKCLFLTNERFKKWNFYKDGTLPCSVYLSIFFMETIPLLEVSASRYLPQCECCDFPISFIQHTFPVFLYMCI